MKIRFFAVFFFVLSALHSVAQDSPIHRISGTIVDDNSLHPLSNVSIININNITGAVTDEKGNFEVNASVNDTLHISLIGYQPINVRVTNDWVKSKTTKIHMTEKAIALEAINIQPYILTGYLEIDSKLIPIRENYRYSISGLHAGYEAGEYAPGSFGNVLGSIFNPADMLYNFFGKKPKELKKLKDVKKDENIRKQLESKYDREAIAVMLNIDKSEIPEILSRCNYSEAFIKTANDLQVMDAISACYEEYKILKKKK